MRTLIVIKILSIVCERRFVSYRDNLLQFTSAFEVSISRFVATWWYGVVKWTSVAFFFFNGENFMKKARRGC